LAVESGRVAVWGGSGRVAVDGWQWQFDSGRMVVAVDARQSVWQGWW
jgi:hypothetical protein